MPSLLRCFSVRNTAFSKHEYIKHIDIFTIFSIYSLLYCRRNWIAVQKIFGDEVQGGEGKWSGREHFWIEATRRLLYVFPILQRFRILCVLAALTESLNGHCRQVPDTLRELISQELQKFLDSLTLQQALIHMKEVMTLVRSQDERVCQQFASFTQWWSHKDRVQRVCGLNEGTQGFVGNLAESGNKMLRRASNGKTLLQSVEADFTVSLLQRSEFAAPGRRQRHQTGPSETALAMRQGNMAVRRISQALDDVADEEQREEAPPAAAGGRPVVQTIYDSHRASARQAQSQVRNSSMTPSGKTTVNTRNAITHRQVQNIRKASESTGQFIKQWSFDIVECGPSADPFLQSMKFKVQSSTRPDKLHVVTINATPNCTCEDWQEQGEGFLPGLDQPTKIYLKLYRRRISIILLAHREGITEGFRSGRGERLAAAKWIDRRRSIRPPALHDEGARRHCCQAVFTRVRGAERSRGEQTQEARQGALGRHSAQDSEARHEARF